MLHLVERIYTYKYAIADRNYTLHYYSTAFQMVGEVKYSIRVLISILKTCHARYQTLNFFPNLVKHLHFTITLVSNCTDTRFELHY